MGNTESVPRERQQQQHKSSRLGLEALQEKYDSFRITEDRETDSMIVERNVRSENRGTPSF
jgi:bleomycin hydrolase